MSGSIQAGPRPSREWARGLNQNLGEFGASFSIAAPRNVSSPGRYSLRSRNGLFLFFRVDSFDIALPIWLAGTLRTVGGTPQIGFHAAYDEDSGQASGAGNAVMGAYLRDLEFAYKAIAVMTRKGPTNLE